MLTPIDIQNKTLKAGMGYKKSDVDALIAELFTDYEYLYKKNAELKEKMHVLSEGIQYYKKIEKTIQGALVLAEQTANETQRVAEDRARAIVDRANNEADAILADARNELKILEKSARQLMQEYERYRLNFKHMMNAQLELLDSEDKNLSRISGQLTHMMEQTAAPENGRNVQRNPEPEQRTEIPSRKRETDTPIAKLDALKEEGRKVAAHMATLAQEEQDSFSKAVPEEDPEDADDFFDFAATKDLSSESEAVMELLQKMEAGESSSINRILEETETELDQPEETPFEFFEADQES